MTHRDVKRINDMKIEIFSIDEVNNFYNQSKKIFRNFYFRKSDYKDFSYSLFIIRSNQTNKIFYRITNNFFIEKT